MAEINLPAEALYAMDRLEKAGYPCYAVGGFVRDAILGVPGHDVDLTCAATPDEMRRVFMGEKIIPTGEKHGTLTLVREGVPLEITTFRADMPYLDGRHPSGVVFSPSLTEDLKRRDFTINAMAYSPTRGFADPFGGREDLAGGILRCVGDPRERFEEDALRLLRALRFAARFGLTIEENTAAALKEKAARIRLVSRERVRDEIEGLILAPGFDTVALKYPDVLFEAVPDLAPMARCPQRCPWHIYDVWEHSVRAVMGVPRDKLLRWSALLHDVGKPAVHTTDESGQDHFRGHEAVGAEMAEQILTGLRLPRKTVDTAVRLIRLHDRRFRVADVKNVMRRLGADETKSLIYLQWGDMLAHSPLVSEKASGQQRLLDEVDRVEKSGEPYTLRQLKINGRDLTAIGLTGSRVGQTLETLLTLVMAGETANEREALLRAARRINK